MLTEKPNTPEEWIIRLSAKEEAGQPLSDSERSQLMEWLVTDPERLKQLKTARLMWQLGKHLPASAAAGIDRPEKGKGWAYLRWSALETLDTLRRPPALAGVALAASCLLAVMVMREPDTNLLKNHSQMRTEIGEISSYVLPDKSDITIGANTSVEVDFTKQHRTIHLNRGEVFIEVEHDRNHPFVIAVGSHEVVVTGTQLNVNYNPTQNAVEVAVVEGSINVVRHNNGRPELQQMTAGDVFYFPSAGPAIRRSVTPEQAAAWRMRQFHFDNARLSQVLTEVNRYTTKPLVADNADVEMLTITGQFVTGDTDTLLFSLERLYGITAKDQGDRWLLTAGEQSRP
jgi:transmembrane sensor